mmetsp:Transcript_109636/g.349714  ORF Transcript_109636/g.349714 Transcript_109636/m.349714 type:complete len:242 (+) Transcript_109636:579-1304(+)
MGPTRAGPSSAAPRRSATSSSGPTRRRARRKRALRAASARRPRRRASLRRMVRPRGGPTSAAPCASATSSSGLTRPRNPSFRVRLATCAVLLARGPSRTRMALSAAVAFRLHECLFAKRARPTARSTSSVHVGPATSGSGSRHPSTVQVSRAFPLPCKRRIVAPRVVAAPRSMRTTLRPRAIPTPWAQALAMLLPVAAPGVVATAVAAACPVEAEPAVPVRAVNSELAGVSSDRAELGLIE